MGKFKVLGLLALVLAGLQPLTALAENNPWEVLSVANVATMTGGSTLPSQHPVVDLRGYYAPGDGGGGTLVWDPNSTATAEPCFTFAVSGISTGRYVRKLDNTTLSLPQCGVKADSSTNNASTLQAAFNALSTYSLGEIYCPASLGTIKFGSTITPISGGSFRGQNNNINTAIGASGNAPGSCHLVYTGGAGTWAFDFQTAVQSATPCPSVQGPRFYNFTLEQSSFGNGFRINNPSTAGYTDDCVGAGGGQSIVTGSVFDGVVTNSSQRGTVGIQVSKAFDTNIQNGYFNFYDTQVQVEGSDNVLIGNNKFNFATIQAVSLASHGTFGNFNTVKDNTFFSTYIDASYFINTSARSGVIDGNYFEQDFPGLDAAINVTCTGLNQTIINNAMEVGPGETDYWLQVTGDCASIRLDNNYNGGGTVPPTNWNAGAGTHWLANAVKQVITGSGNLNFTSHFPFLTQEFIPKTGSNAPAAAGAVMGEFNSSVDDGNLSGDYASAIFIGPVGSPGDFKFDAKAAPLGHITFVFPQTVIGTIDLWLYAYTSSTSQQFTCTDGVGTNTFTLSSGTTRHWYQVLINDAVTNPTIDCANNDTTHGQPVFVKNWQAVRH